MSERRHKRPRVKADETTDLFRILKNMCRDPKVSDAHFRLAFRIAQCRNEDTEWAEASHDFLIDEVPRTQKGKIRGFRDVMVTELGWLRTIKGERGRGTMYQFQDARCAEIEAESDRKRSDRHAASALSKIERITALKAAGMRGKSSPPNDAGIGVDPSPFEGQISTPVLPHRTTSTEGYRKPDVTQDARAHTPAGAPVPARACPPPCECGEPGVIWGRLSAGSELRAWCQECSDDLILTDRRPV